MRVIPAFKCAVGFAKLIGYELIYQLIGGRRSLLRRPHGVAHHIVRGRAIKENVRFKAGALEQTYDPGATIPLEGGIDEILMGPL
jgi:hypothetical protein